MARFTIKQEAYAAIEAKYRCAHLERELRLRIISDGRPTYWRQCIRCGHTARAEPTKMAKLELQGKIAPSFDNDLSHQWRGRKHAEYIATYSKIAPALQKEYEEYLASKEWAKRREATLSKANDICECCEHFKATQAHHLSYDRIGQELDSDLLAVCSFCHKLIHSHMS